MTTSSPSSPAAVQPNARVRITPSVYARAFGTEIILLEFHRGEYFGLDAVGAAIWRLLEGGSTLAAAADAMVARYDVAREDVLRDIVTLVGDMRDNALVTTEPA